jgi:hypothetical protein
VGKRSPILGYNHNVRYRGLVFHVQTEDSGVSTPHLFTHLFHHGVIVSTRKLDYDAGSAEESIKSLMQAQHKAVLKDLRRGSFDDKIDSYLGGTPGLLPRGVEEAPERASEAELAPSTGTVEMVAGAPTEQVLPLVLDELSEPIIVIEDAPSRPTPPPLPARAIERRSAPAASAAATGPAAAVPAARGSTGAIERSETGGGVPDGFAGGPGGRVPRGIDTTLKTAVPAFELSELDLSPEIEIHLLDDGDDQVTRARRVTRDTETHVPVTDQTRPTLQMEHDDQTRPTLGADALGRVPTVSDGVPGAIRPASPALSPAPDSRRLGDRPSTIHAATLPPARPISRPASRPALSPAPVVPRPASADERHRREPEAVEGYPPTPLSAELSQGERPGQYAQHKKAGGRTPADAPKNERERSSGVPVPAGLGRPQRAGSAPPAKTGAGTPVPSAPPTPVPRDPAPRGGNHTEPLRGRVPTPARLPVTGRASAGGGAGSGVVMSRPAVIVGAPQKTTGTVPRIRKAREDEGRGFGQGLISEKSLDEVILAYLSEDADEK